MSELGIGIAIIAGIIIAMVLINKLLEFLFYRFTIIYCLILIMIAVSSNMVLIIQGIPEAFPTWYAGVQVLFFYLSWTNCAPEKYTTTEGSAHYNEFTNTIHAEAHEEEHYRPGWWVKLVTVAVFTVIALALSIWIAAPVITLIAELILPTYGIIMALRR